jgi:hypothetical protein
MKKAYLLVYSAEVVAKQEEMAAFLGTLQDIVSHWRYDMSSAFYLISTSEAKTIATRLRTLTGDKGRILVTELTSNSWGWLTEESWYLINQKEYKPKATNAA